MSTINLKLNNLKDGKIEQDLYCRYCRFRQNNTIKKLSKKLGIKHFEVDNVAHKKTVMGRIK